MDTQTITYDPAADPSAVAKIEAARAALKPCCTRCRRNLLKRELTSENTARVCTDRDMCTVRAITRPSEAWVFNWRRA